MTRCHGFLCLDGAAPNLNAKKRAIGDFANPLDFVEGEVRIPVHTRQAL
jgi:hypothetical protein